MPMCTVYISGPISNGTKSSDKNMQDNVRIARKVALDLWKIKGIYVICPHLNSPWATKEQFFDTGMSYNELISKDLGLIEKCDCIFMLKNWEMSEGAVKEHFYAEVIGIPIFYFDEIKKLKEFITNRKVHRCHLCLTDGKIKVFRIGPKKYKLCDKCIRAFEEVRKSAIKELKDKYLILPKL